MLVTSLARKLFGNPSFLGCILRKMSTLEEYLIGLKRNSSIKKNPKSNHSTKKIIKAKLK